MWTEQNNGGGGSTISGVPVLKFSCSPVSLDLLKDKQELGTVSYQASSMKDLQIDALITCLKAYCLQKHFH